MVRMLSSILYEAGLAVSISDVLQFPPMASRSNLVNFEELYGTSVTPSLPSPNGTFYVIESALTGASVTTATSGIAGTVATMTTNQPVSWSLSDDLSGKLTISGSAVGYITLKDNLSGSAYQNGSVLSGVVRATNTYGLYKENNISVTVTDNVGASISPNLSFLNNYYTKDGAASFGNILVFDPQSIENVELIGIGGPDGDKFIFVSQSEDRVYYIHSLLLKL